MTTTNESHWKRRHRRFAVEWLEGRLLLSGLESVWQPEVEAVSPSADVAAMEQLAYGYDVQVLKISPADEERDTARTILIEGLPQAVVSSVSDRFPGARLVAAEEDSEDGLLLYDISATFNGLDLDVTLLSDGNVMAIEQALDALDLPQAVRGWISSNFPGASIGEAELVSELDTLSYEVSINTPTNQSLEATLRVPGGNGRGTTGARREAGDAQPPSVFTSSAVLGAWRFAHADASDSEPVRATESRSAAAETAPPNPAAHQVPLLSLAAAKPKADHRDMVESRSNSDAEPRDTAPLIGTFPDSNPADTAGVDLVAGPINPVLSLSAMLRPIVLTIAPAIPATWLPEIAQTLNNVLPVDITASERSLQEFLDAVQSLASRIAPGATASGLTPLLLSAAAVLWGTELLIRDMSETRSVPVVTVAQASQPGRASRTWRR